MRWLSLTILSLTAVMACSTRVSAQAWKRPPTPPEQLTYFWEIGIQDRVPPVVHNQNRRESQIDLSAAPAIQRGRAKIIGQQHMSTLR